MEQLNDQDIPWLIRLSDERGWDYDESEVKTIMRSGAVYGHRTDTNEIVSCAAIISYKEELASLGMVIVHPEYRRLGLGRAVTVKCIQSLPRSTPIMLIATPEGKPMYERLGFKSVNHVQKFLCESFQEPIDLDVGEYSLEPRSLSDVHEIMELDRFAFGARRDEFLTRRMQQAHQVVVAKDISGKVAGYAFSIQGTANLLVGPVVAPNYRVAMHLMKRLLRGNVYRIRIDIPQEQSEFASALIQCGFEVVSHPPIMLLNKAELPPRNSQLFGIAAQIFG